MTTEAKVGLFTVIAVVLALAIIVRLSHFSFGGPPHYNVTVSFKYVDGLKPGALVRYAGVDVGDVASVKTDGMGAKVVLEIKKNVNIPQSSVITISSDGLMGEKFVNIYSNGNPSKAYLENGAVMRGTEERSINALIKSAADTLDKVDKMVTAMNKVIANPKVQDSLIKSAVNIKQITDNMNQATAVMADVMQANKANINDIIRNLTVASANVQNITGDVQNMVEQLNGDGKMTDDMRTTVGNLAQTSTRIEHMAANLEPVISDPQTANELRNIIHNASDVSQRADHMMKKINSIKMKTGTEVLYSGKKSDLMVNADLKIYNNPNDFLLIGGDDIGGDNPAMNLQLGSGNKNFSGRVGIIDNKAGLGIDAYSGPWKFSVDAYDIDDVRLKLRSQYRLSSDIYLLGQISDLNDADRAAYFGIRKEF
ncbi:MlaD family protein [Pectinatus sottacetonis]|uniref:MlaD family protein n=1 Tax=Pectinatus sottacetonis TaxID=1002795 RepID=UPI0018C80C2B|nr:MlaD family protein [Pectinatus sottacetonis]